MTPAKRSRSDGGGEGVGKGALKKKRKIVTPATAASPAEVEEVAMLEEDKGDEEVSQEQAVQEQAVTEQVVGGSVVPQEAAVQKPSPFDIHFEYQSNGVHIGEDTAKCVELMKCLKGQGYRRQTENAFLDRMGYPIWAEEHVRSASHVNYMVNQAERIAINNGKLAKENALLGDRLKEAREQTKAANDLAESARKRAKAAEDALEESQDLLKASLKEKTEKINDLKGQVETQKRLKEESAKVLAREYADRLRFLQKCFKDVEEAGRQTSLINQVEFALEVFEGFQAKGYKVFEETIKKVKADLVGLKKKFAALDVDEPTPPDFMPLSSSGFPQVLVLTLGQGGADLSLDQM